MLSVQYTAALHMCSKCMKTFNNYIKSYNKHLIQLQLYENDINPSLLVVNRFVFSFYSLVERIEENDTFKVQNQARYLLMTSIVKKRFPQKSSIVVFIPFV